MAAGALHMRPLDIDPMPCGTSRSIGTFLQSQPGGRRSDRRPDRDGIPGDLGVLDPTPMPAEGPVRLDKLQVPTLVLWAAKTRGSIERLNRGHRPARASKSGSPGMYFYWKQYGVRPRLPRAQA